MIRTILLCLLTMLTCSVTCRGQQHHGDGLDDVLQHAPMAALLTLRAAGCDGETQSWGRLLITAATAYAAGAGATWGLKETCHERRPDGSDRRAMPSGHTMFAFAGATMLAHEYWNSEPWVAAGGFALATLVAADRVRRDRHYTHDVLAGAAIGAAATELSYWLTARIMPKSDKVSLAVSPEQLSLTVRW